MPLKLCSLSSSSQGNCIYVASETTQILIDAGLPFLQVKKCLLVIGKNKQINNTQSLAGDANKNQPNPSPQINAILITHAHRDHVAGLATVANQTKAAVYAHYAIALEQKFKKQFNRVESAPFMVGDIIITPFLVSHDVPCSGFKLQSGGATISVLTDVGHVSEQLIDSTLASSDILFIEANHDEQLLKNGHYPYYLKRRILSHSGHLSNSECATVCKRVLAKGKTRQIILGHLSKENNTTELARTTIQTHLKAAGFFEGKHYALDIATREGMSGLFEVRTCIHES